MNFFVIAAREFVDNYNFFWSKVRHRLVSKFAESCLRNLDIINSIEGAKTSAIFEKRNLLKVPTFKSRTSLFKLCLNEAQKISGLYLEFGTYKGNSINTMAHYMPHQKFYGFDSFEGLPENWTPGCRTGAFSLGGKLPRVRNNVELIKGFFNESLPRFLTTCNNQKVAFIHIDCDLYSSTKYVLEMLKPMMVKGTIICFDEYYNYPEWEDGEYKAWQEFIANNNSSFEYIGYIRIGSQVAIRYLG